MASSPLPAIIEATFTAAAGPEGELPAPTMAEVAFAGRSNVGKSTLMNAMLARKHLVRTSNTPGCTRTINMFHARAADGLELYLVDLPGYGYAKRSKSERTSWGPLLERYLASRSSLRALVVLVDARRGLEQEEEDLIHFVASAKDVTRPKLPVFLVATKVDTLPLSQRKLAVAKAGRAGLPALGVSGETGEGVDVLWRKLRVAVGVAPAEELKRGVEAGS